MKGRLERVSLQTLQSMFKKVVALLELYAQGRITSMSGCDAPLLGTVLNKKGIVEAMRRRVLRHLTGILADDNVLCVRADASPGQCELAGALTGLLCGQYAIESAEHLRLAQSVERLHPPPAPDDTTKSARRATRYQHGVWGPVLSVIKDAVSTFGTTCQIALRASGRSVRGGGAPLETSFEGCIARLYSTAMFLDALNLQSLLRCRDIDAVARAVRAVTTAVTTGSWDAVLKEHLLRLKVKREAVGARSRLHGRYGGVFVPPPMPNDGASALSALMDDDASVALMRCTILGNTMAQTNAYSFLVAWKAAVQKVVSTDRSRHAPQPADVWHAVVHAVGGYLPVFGVKSRRFQAGMRENGTVIYRKHLTLTLMPYHVMELEARLLECVNGDVLTHPLLADINMLGGLAPYHALIAPPTRPSCVVDLAAGVHGTLFTVCIYVLYSCPGFHKNKAFKQRAAVIAMFADLASQVLKGETLSDDDVPIKLELQGAYPFDSEKPVQHPSAILKNIPLLYVSDGSHMHELPELVSNVLDAMATAQADFRQGAAGPGPAHAPFALNAVAKAVGLERVWGNGPHATFLESGYLLKLLRAVVLLRRQFGAYVTVAKLDRPIGRFIYLPYADFGPDNDKEFVVTPYGRGVAREAQRGSAATRGACVCPTELERGSGYGCGKGFGAAEMSASVRAGQWRGRAEGCLCAQDQT